MYLLKTIFFRRLRAKNEKNVINYPKIMQNDKKKGIGAWGGSFFNADEGCVKIRGFVAYSGVFDHRGVIFKGKPVGGSRKFFLLLSDFDDFCGCCVILSEFGGVVSSACEFEE